MLTLLIATSTMAQSDFNFSFYPAPKYNKLDVVNKRDSVTQKIVTTIDTTSKPVNVLVEKLNNRLSIRTLADISGTLYDLNVRFLGFDESGNLMYQAQTEQREIVFIHPSNGYIEIVFRTCFDIPIEGNTVAKYCNESHHVFGNIPKPKPPTPQTTPTPTKN